MELLSSTKFIVRRTINTGLKVTTFKFNSSVVDNDKNPFEVNLEINMMDLLRVAPRWKKYDEKTHERIFLCQ